jgi:hypothetical protein
MQPARGAANRLPIERRCGNSWELKINEGLYPLPVTRPGGTGDRCLIRRQALVFSE